MKITVDIESLIRDSEKIRIIESLLEAEGYICEKTLSAVLGRCIPEKSPTELPFAVVSEKDTEPEAERKPEPKSTLKARIDWGKVMALHNAGWTNKAIAEEMGCAESRVSMLINKAGGSR